MPSPVGHILGGIAVYVAATRDQYRSRGLCGVILVGSMLPDLDFLPGLMMGDPGAFHHGASHSFMFAILFGLLILFLTPGGSNALALRAGMLAASACISHVVLDLVSVTGDGARGMPVFWPLSAQTFGINLNLLGHFHHEGLRCGIWSVIQWRNVPALLRELSVIGLPLLIIMRWDRHRQMAYRARRESGKSVS